MEPSFLQNRYIKGFLIILSVLLAVLIVWYGVGTYKSLTAKSDEAKDTLTISAVGEIESKPDLALASFAVVSEGKDPKKIQADNTAKIKQVINYLKTKGVKEGDITTSDYSMYPRYNYPDGRQELDAYVLSQGLSVKIRQIDDVGDIITGVIQNGANTFNNVSFQIDQPEGLKQEARKKAMENAKAKADELAKVAGVKLGKVKSFSEESISFPEPYPYAYDSYGRGGDAMAAEASQIMPGTNKITATVSVVFELED
ncbi:MAG: SIMPL domain-containing protein [Patescibacteria group bacterium]